MTEMDYSKFEGHIPGPWRATYNSAKERSVRDAAGFIAFMPKPFHYTGQDERYEQEMAEYAATQALLAAAPDLLAENKRLRVAMESLESGVLTALSHTGVSDNDPHFRLTEADKILRQAMLYVRRLNEQK